MIKLLFILLFGIGIASDSMGFLFAINKTESTCSNIDNNNGCDHFSSYDLNPGYGFYIGANKTINSIVPVPLIIGFGFSRISHTYNLDENYSWKRKHYYLHASGLYPYSLNLKSAKEIRVLAGIDFSLLPIIAHTSPSGSTQTFFISGHGKHVFDLGILFGTDYKINNKLLIGADYRFGLLNQGNREIYSSYEHRVLRQSFKIYVNYNLDLGQGKKSGNSGKKSGDSDIIIY